MKRFRPTVEALEQRLALANVPSLIAPIYHSLSSASASLYLDFNGSTDTYPGIPGMVDTPPYDTDGNPNAFSAQELKDIEDIWKYVAEDYAPFRLDVTTQQPANFNAKVAMKVAIGGNGSWLVPPLPGILGIATGIGDFASGSYRTCFAFSVNHPTVKDIGDTVSHEAGHMFGLLHQSEYAGAMLVNTYYPGPGDGTAPIMGDPTGTRGLWWYGTTTSSGTFQDDMAVLSGATNGFGYRNDDHGSTTSTAVSIPPPNTPTASLNASGNIERMTDADMFRIAARSGPISVNVSVPAPYNNLDVLAQLLDKNGNVVASSNPAGNNAFISYTISTPGTYYVAIKSSGPSSGATANDYGFNVGTYTITGTYNPLVEAVKFYSPLRWSYNPRTGVYSGRVTYVSNTSSSSSRVATITLPPGVQIITPTGSVSGNTLTLNLPNGSANAPQRLFIQLKNPLKVSLGSYFTGFITSGKI